jgi:hypothetical protein
MISYCANPNCRRKFEFNLDDNQLRVFYDFSRDLP